MRGIVAVRHQLGVGADLAVAAGNQPEQTENATLVHGAEDKGGGRFQQALLGVLAEADSALLSPVPDLRQSVPESRVTLAVRAPSDLRIRFPPLYLIDLPLRRPLKASFSSAPGLWSGPHSLCSVLAIMVS